MAESIANPILNSPYDPPERHGPHGPTGEIKVGAAGRDGRGA